jgi:thiol-disulfide isomerase/thioredoxin
MTDQLPQFRSRLQKYGSILLNVGVVLVMFFVVMSFQSRNMLPTDRQPAPALRGVTLQGGAYDLEANPGRPALVYFFAPWCNYCAASSDNLVRLRLWREKTDLDIITVALDWRNVEEVSAYADRHDLNIPVVLGDSQVARDWRVYAFPTYYVLDSQHRIVRRDLGYSTQAGLWWRSSAVN